MNAVQLLEVGGEMVDVELPELVPGPGEIVVAVKAAGICHSDEHYRSGAVPLRRLPLTPGHEVAGTVRARGPGVTTPEVGERVALHYLVSCGECDRCRRHGEQFCERGEMLGKDRDGGYAGEVLVPAWNAVPIPENLSTEVAAVMMCSTSTAYHALQLSALREGESVGILGFGGLGVSALHLARALGAGAVFAFDRSPEKLRFAVGAGAAAIATDSGGIEAEVRDRTGGRGLDVVLDFVGSPTLSTEALRCLAPSGRFMLVALSQDPFAFNPYRDVLAKEARIIGCSDHLRSELVDLFRLTESGRLDLGGVVTRRVPLRAREVNEVLRDLASTTSHFRSVIRVAPNS